MRLFKFLWITLGVLVTFLLVVGTLGKLLETPEERAKDAAEAEIRDLSLDAALRLKDVVHATLKAPSTAVFPSIANWTIRPMGGKTFFVSSHVDAQNGFGAQIRTRFSATMTKTKKGWEVDHLAMG